MIVYKDNKGFQTRSDKPNENWTGEDVFVVDDNSELAQRIIKSYPYYDFIEDGGVLVDIVELDRPPEESSSPEETQTKRVESLEQSIAELTMAITIMMGGM